MIIWMIISAKLVKKSPFLISYLKVLVYKERKISGIPYLIRKALLFATPTVEVVKSPDPEYDWSITTHEAFTSVEMKFKFGKEFEEVLPRATLMVSDKNIRFVKRQKKVQFVY